MDRKPLGLGFLPGRYHLADAVRMSSGDSGWGQQEGHPVHPTLQSERHSLSQLCLESGRCIHGWECAWSKMLNKVVLSMPVPPLALSFGRNVSGERGQYGNPIDSTSRQVYGHKQGPAGIPIGSSVRCLANGSLASLLRFRLSRRHRQSLLFVDLRVRILQVHSSVYGVWK